MLEVSFTYVQGNYSIPTIPHRNISEQLPQAKTSAVRQRMTSGEHRTSPVVECGPVRKEAGAAMELRGRQRHCMSTGGARVW